MACCVQMAVECVIAPESIDITIDDIGGLDRTIAKLVSFALSTGYMSVLVAQARRGALGCRHGSLLCFLASDTIA